MSPGIDCRPASNAYVVNGSDTNTATAIIQARAYDGRPSQSAALELNDLIRPIWCRKTLMTPLFASSAHRKTSAVIVTDAAHGAISAHRATRRPGHRALNTCANTIEIAIVTITTAPTQIT